MGARRGGGRTTAAIARFWTICVAKRGTSSAIGSGACLAGSIVDDVHR
jgi:hypothetical protein